MNEQRTTLPLHPEADADRKQQREQALTSVEAQILALAGERADDARRLVNRYNDLVSDLDGIEERHHLREAAEFMLRYGVPDLWKALYLRFGCNVSTGGWALAEFYCEGDEWRFVFGEDWRRWVKRAKDDQGGAT